MDPFYIVSPFDGTDKREASFNFVNWIILQALIDFLVHVWANCQHVLQQNSHVCTLLDSFEKTEVLKANKDEQF